MDTIRWGFLATGTIAHAMARDLALLPDARLEAVAARRRSSAEAFAAEFNGRALDSYDDLGQDPDVDVVYVASPHALHAEQVRMLLESGKPVLCEKALTLNAADAEPLFELARTRRLFLMEGMWMACHPLVRHLRQRCSAGDFGEPRQLTADLGFRVDRPADDRLFAPELGGGALLDMGVYPLTLAQLFLGDPVAQVGVAHLSERGIDLDVAVSARYASGAVAALTSSMTSPSPRAATISTDTGRLVLPAPFHHPSYAEWTPYVDGQAGETVRIDPPQPIIGTGLANEAAEVMRCLREGLTESPLVPHVQTLAVLRQMDDLRSQFGVVYPGEKRG